MRTMYEHEPEMDPAESNDVTLGMAALLGIFFVIVLICAVFFGFGYSTGRHLHLGGGSSSKSAPVASSSLPASGSGGDTTSLPAQNQAQAATPEAAATPALTTVTPASKPLPGDDMTAQADPSSSEDLPVARRTARADAFRPAAHAPRPAVLAPPAPAADVVPGGVMVQIAAVGKQGDAEALAQALRKNGFQAIIRTEPQDKFLHVQVGPFATRDQARAMRTRLQSDGYNAFMKP